MFICEKNYSCCNHQYWDRWEDVEKDAKECGHLIEVSEVRHGRWEFRYIPDVDWYSNTPAWFCTHCGWHTVDKSRKPKCPNLNYCPHCGAKMDLEE